MNLLALSFGWPPQNIIGINLLSSLLQISGFNFFISTKTLSFSNLSQTKMVAPNTNEVPTIYDRKSEVKAFDDTKEGVKGLVDAGITEVPRIFYQPPEPDDHYSINITSSDSQATQFSIPVIDLEGLGSLTKRKEIVAKVGEASETWGFFQIENHGISAGVLEEIKDGVRGFYEQDTRVKKELYTRNHFRPVIYHSNFDLYTAPATNWRDSFMCYMAPNPPKPEDFPEVCRYVTTCTELNFLQ